MGGKLEVSYFPFGAQGDGWETELSEMPIMGSYREPSVPTPWQQKPFFLPHREIKSRGNCDRLPSTFCVYQALLGALLASSFIPNNPGTGLLLLS